MDYFNNRAFVTFLKHVSYTNYYILYRKICFTETVESNRILNKFSSAFHIIHLKYNVEYDIIKKIAK